MQLLHVQGLSILYRYQFCLHANGGSESLILETPDGSSDWASVSLLVDQDEVMIVCYLFEYLLLNI